MPNWKKVIVSGSDAILNNITASGNVSGSATSTASFGTYIGDGSQLSGISTTPFPFTGDAQISGSLIVSQSYTAGDTDSTALRLLGSGSVSQSGIFEVEGSAGPLFSVQDGLDGVLMEVNNISGLPLFQVSSSNEVFVNRGNLTSGVTTATASFANFSGSFQGDGSNLTGVTATTPTLAQVVTAGASATGDVSITGSLTITGSLISVGIQKQADVTNTVMGPGAGGTSMDWNGTSAFGENILIGSGSGKSLTISKQNTFIGNLTGTSAGAGVNYNTLVGYKAGNRLYVGGYNTFVGTTAGGAALINGGNFNTFLGYGAGDNITSGDSNVFLGASAGALIQEGSNNIGIGHEALYNSDTSGNNIAIGTSALRLLDVAGSSNTATDNIAIGHNSAASLTSGTKNIIIGSGSLAADNPSHQIRIGHADLHIISGSLTTGDVIFYNTASAPNFSGSFQGDGSNLTNLNTTTPTLQQVTTAGNSTDQGLIVSGSTIFKPLTSSPANIEFSTEAYSGAQNPTITLKNSAGQKTVHIGHSINDGLLELYNSTETRVVSIQEHFQAFSPPGGLSSGYGTYFGVTSSISPSVASPDSYVKIAHDGYSGVPYSILQLNKKGTFAGSGSITLQGIMNSNNNSAPSVGITSVNGNRVVNFGGPGFVNANNVHNNYLKYGLQVGGDFTGNSSNMALTDGSLIMSGSTGGFSVKSVSSEAEIKTNDGDTTLTLGTTSSLVHVEATTFKGDGSNLTNLPASDPFPFTGSAHITGSTQLSGELKVFGSSPSISSLKIDNGGYFYHLGFYDGGSTAFANNATNTIIGNDIADDGDYYNTIIGYQAGVSNPGHANVIIGVQAVTNGNIDHSVAIGATAQTNNDGDISIGSDAGDTADSKGINIGRYAHGEGVKGIVLNTAGVAVSPTKANTFGIYMTDASPNFEIEATGSSTLSGSSFTIEKSGSTVFEVIGSEGTLFSVDDDLDGTIFTANDRSGLPVLEASASGEVYIGKSPQSLYTTAVISSTTAATTQSIFGLSTSSYGGAFFDYTVQSGSDARAGSIMSVWNGSNISFTETTTTDIGDTTDFNVIVHISQSQAQIASHATRAGYNIKTIIRSI
tara:strand:+ start:7556 stop:10855 length:3300 start_codon:yes stop_codon:yes gene_type:complete